MLGPSWPRVGRAPHEVHFYFLQQSLCDAGLNIAAAVLAVLLAALASIFLRYYLNIRFGPQLYYLLL